MVADAARIAIVSGRERYGKGERLNIAASGKRFLSNFIEPGLVDYSDVGGDLELLRKETIDEALNTALGNPLTLGHVSTRINQSELSRLTRGTIDKVGYNAESGWFFCGGVVADDSTRERIRRNGKSSCGYTVLEFGPGGTYHNIAYAREITRIKFHHLAIVDNPRYEAADIRLNGKTKPAMNPIKWIKKVLRPATEAGGTETTVEETGTLPADTTFELPNGKTARLNELTEAKVKADAVEAAAATERANAIDGDTMIEYAPGKHAKLNELCTSYSALGERDNESDEDKTEREEKEKKDRANAKAKADARENGTQSFRVLAAARNSPPPVTTERANSANSISEQVQRGRDRYGSRATAAGKN